MKVLERFKEISKVELVFVKDTAVSNSTDSNSLKIYKSKYILYHRSHE